MSSHGFEQVDPNLLAHNVFASGGDHSDLAIALRNQHREAAYELGRLVMQDHHKAAGADQDERRNLEAYRASTWREEPRTVPSDDELPAAIDSARQMIDDGLEAQKPVVEQFQDGLVDNAETSMQSEFTQRERNETMRQDLEAFQAQHKVIAGHRIDGFRDYLLREELFTRDEIDSIVAEATAHLGQIRRLPDASRRSSAEYYLLQEGQQMHGPHYPKLIALARQNLTEVSPKAPHSQS